MDCSQMASHEEDKASNYEGDESPSGHNETMPSKGKRKRLGDNVIPKKHGKEVDEDTDPYASDDDDSEDDRDDVDRNRNQGNRDTNAKSRRFDPDSSSVEYSLDEDKESYAKKYFQMHLTEEKINTRVFDQSSVPAQIFDAPGC